MWPLGIVVGDPRRNIDASMGQAEEQALVQQLIAHATVNTLAEAVLYGLAGRDVMPVDPVGADPNKNGVRRELSAVVGDDHFLPGIHAARPRRY